MLKKTLVFAALLCAPPLYAQSLVTGNTDAGKTKSVPCSACHGVEGISVQSLWPNLAGQNAKYIVKQLQAFKNGERQDPLMTSQAQALSDQDIQDLAVYFETKTPAVQAIADKDLLDNGQALYRGGSAAESAPACMACHGPGGRGNPAAAYPMLKGQHSDYIAKQLRDYDAGTRKSDGKTHTMRDVASHLNEKDIVAVASYVQGLK